MRHLDGKATTFLLILLAGLALAGCSPKEHSRATAISGEQAAPAHSWPTSMN